MMFNRCTPNPLFDHHLLGLVAMVTVPAMTREAARHGFESSDG